MKKIQINEAYCMGCRICEIYCSFAHSDMDDIIKAFKKEATPPPGLIVEEREHTSFALHCAHMEHPDCGCISACITGALYRDEDGFVQHDEEKCIGCYMCVMNCPIGVIKIDKNKNKIVSKCDRCVERGMPACVEHCPNEAILLIDDEKD